MKNITFFLLLLMIGCKSTHTITTKDHIVNDTIIRHEVRSVQLPVKNITIIDSPCKEDTLKNINQTIVSGKSSITIKKEKGNLVITQNVDSIVNSKVKEILKHKEQKIQTVDKLVVKYRVARWCWWVLIYAVLSTVWIFRKPLLKIIKPI